MRREETALPSAGSCPPGSGQRGAGCCMHPAAAAPSHPAPSHPTPSHPEKRRAETSQTPRRAEGEPGCPRSSAAAVRPRSPAALPCFARPSAGRGGRARRFSPHRPGGAQREPGREGTGGDGGIPAPGSGAAGTGAPASGADAVAEGRAPRGRRLPPSPAAHPGAAAPLCSAPSRAVRRSAGCAAPGAFPGQPRIFRNLPPGAERRGRDRQRGRRNHVGLRDGYNTFYLEKHYITLRDVTWDS